MTLSSKLIDLDCIEYSYKRKFDCPVSNLKSCMESYCHCSYIDDFNITDIHYHNIVKFLFEYLYPKSKENNRLFKIFYLLNDITRSSEYYLIDRLCSIYKLWDKSSYIPNIYNGYYGKELNGILIKEEIAHKIEYHFNEIQKKESLQERIFYILLLEYGTILDILKNKNVLIKKIDNKEIKLLNKEYHNKINSKLIEYKHYKKYGIKGILVKENNKYILVDGYHRYVSNLNRKSLYLIFESL